MVEPQWIECSRIHTTVREDMVERFSGPNPAGPLPHWQVHVSEAHAHTIYTCTLTLQAINSMTTGRYEALGATRQNLSSWMASKTITLTLHADVAP